MAIQTCDLPADALLRNYMQDGNYTDCFLVKLPGDILLGQYVEAFYTTWLFKSERIILSLGGYSSTDAEAANLAREDGVAFAAWRVEIREADQLLMCDASGRTRSWFKVAPIYGDNGLHTMLYFGSAITAVETGKSGQVSIGPVFKSLTGFHKLYSRALLAATRNKIALTAPKVTA